MHQWLPMLAAHRIFLAAAHTGLSPWAAAVPLLAADTTGGADPISAATQTVLGFGVLGVVALALAYITWKGSFVPAKRVDELVVAGRADLLRELEQLRAEKAKVDGQLAEALRFARDDLTPILFQFTSATSSLLPILQQMVYRQQAESPRPREIQ